MEAVPGTYALILESSSKKSMKIGGLGNLLVQPGFYTYIGSALGTGGLKARVSHHLNTHRRAHWHIDYLRKITPLVEVWYRSGRDRFEHQWAEEMKRLSLPIPGFGCSDCTCRSHLFFSDTKPSRQGLENQLRTTLQSCSGEALNRNILRT